MFHPKSQKLTIKALSGTKLYRSSQLNGVEPFLGESILKIFEKIHEFYSLLSILSSF
jgi:hypothetical protein